MSLECQLTIGIAARGIKSDVGRVVARSSTEIDALDCSDNYQHFLQLIPKLLYTPITSQSWSVTGGPNGTLFYGTFSNSASF